MSAEQFEKTVNPGKYGNFIIPLHLTVEERMVAECHKISCVDIDCSKCILYYRNPEALAAYKKWRKINDHG